MIEPKKSSPLGRNGNVDVSVMVAASMGTSASTAPPTNYGVSSATSVEDDLSSTFVTSIEDIEPTSLRRKAVDYNVARQLQTQLRRRRSRAPSPNEEVVAYQVRGYYTSLSLSRH